MSFALPTERVVVDKYATEPTRRVDRHHEPVTLANVVEPYKAFWSIVKQARMDQIFADSSTPMTVFVPIDNLPEFDVGPTFERARTIVNSVTVPTTLTYSVLAQGRSRYKTRDALNTLTTALERSADGNPENLRPIVVLNGVSRFIMSDVKTSNGIMHLIDKFPYSDF